MKKSHIWAFAPVLLATALAGNAFGNVSSSLILSAAAAVAAGQSLTVTEKLLSTFSGGVNEIDSVLQFDPAFFSLSNFQIGSDFSTWSTSANSSPSSGIYDFGMHGVTDTLTSGNQYTVLTFTVTALANASGSSNILIVPGTGFITTVLNGEQVRPLSPTPSPTFVSGDLAITVTGSGTPEPGTFLLGGLALGGVLIFAQRRRNRIA